MTRIYPIFVQPYIELCRHAERDDRLHYAFDFIDEIICVFIKYGQKGDGHALINIIKQGEKEWKKLVRYEIVVHVDEDGYEYLLDVQTYPDYILKRFLDTSIDKKSFDEMKGTILKIFNHFNYTFIDPGEYDDWEFPPSTPAPSGEAGASEGENNA